MAPTPLVLFADFFPHSVLKKAHLWLVHRVLLLQLIAHPEGPDLQYDWRKIDRFIDTKTNHILISVHRWSISICLFNPFKQMHKHRCRFVDFKTKIRHNQGESFTRVFRLVFLIYFIVTLENDDTWATGLSSMPSMLTVPKDFSSPYKFPKTITRERCQLRCQLHRQSTRIHPIYPWNG